MRKYICENCGKEFKPHNSNSKFCSIECYKSSEKKKVEVVCAECGKIEFVRPSRAKTYKCCSVKCLGEYNSKNCCSMLSPILMFSSYIRFYYIFYFFARTYI